MEKFNYLIIGLMTLNIVYSLYYIISRPLLGVDIYGSWIILYVASAEYAPSLLSFILGAIGDVYGRRRILLLGSLGFIPLLFVFTVSDWRLILVSIFFYSLFTSIVSVIALSCLIEDRTRIGTKYSRAGLSMGIGWGFGSSLAWPLYLKIGRYGFAVMLSTLYIVSILMILKGYIGKERDASRGLIIGLQHVYSGLSRFIPVLLFSSIGLAIGSNVNALILDSKLRDLFSIFNTGFELRIFYGFFCGTLPVLLGSPLRLIIGRLVDKGYEKTMFTASILTYLILYLILPHTQPVIFIILWMLPVYPFYDTSIYAIISRSTSRYEATVTGFISTINSLAGLSLLLLNSTVPINNPAAYSIQILLFLGVPIMLTAMSTRRIKPLNTLSVIHN